MERILGATSYTVMRWYFASDGYNFARSSDKRSCNSAENSIPVAIFRLANLVIDRHRMNSRPPPTTAKCRSCFFRASLAVGKAASSKPIE